jgi:hypothetical protein
MALPAFNGMLLPSPMSSPPPPHAKSVSVAANAIAIFAG